MVLVHNYDFDAPYATVERLSPAVRRVVCQNPGPFTFKGTATFVVGSGQVAIIDPGPRYQPHLDALLAALEPHESVTAIVVTHTHPDHSTGAAWLHEQTGAPTFGFGPHAGGHATEDLADEAEDPIDFSDHISEAEQASFAAEWEALPAEVKFEGYDLDFDPDERLADGELVSGPDWSLRAVHTPGHCSNHLCFALDQEGTLFSGDHVMGWATSVISPPDGQMSAYLNSLRHLGAGKYSLFRPTHGPAIEDPGAYVDALLHHRLARETQIIDQLTGGPKRIVDMVPTLYAGYDKRLWYPAVGSVYAHILGLVDTGVVGTDDPAPTRGARYYLA